VYVALSAQAKAKQRQLYSAHNKAELKNPAVYAYVTEKLRGGWSPEQIAGRLREVDHKNDPHWQINHETIYQWIYAQPPKVDGTYWWEYLRRKQKKRKKQKGRTVRRGNIPDRVSISERPDAINSRTELGHWEGDSVEGKRGESGAGLHTEVERMSRIVKASKVKRLTSRQAYYAQCRIFSSEPACAVKSTTLDNGKETHEHYRLRKKFDMMTYHAHPYSSYERGTNEHGNWHLRYYFPKGTDFATVTRTELQAVVDEINDRPRKIHHYLSAYEVYYKLVEKVKV
jgi:IS30 family transposase